MWGTLIVLTVPVWIIGCGLLANPPAFEREVIVGTWEGANGSQLTFSENGRFSAAAFPGEYFNDTVGSQDGAGEWRVAEGDPDAILRIELTFEPSDDFPVGFSGVLLNIDGTREAPELTVAIGDPDNGEVFTYTKTDLDPRPN